MLTGIIERPIDRKNVCGVDFPQYLTIERHDPLAYLAPSKCVMTGTVTLHIVRPIGGVR